MSYLGSTEEDAKNLTAGALVHGIAPGDIPAPGPSMFDGFNPIKQPLSGLGEMAVDANELLTDSARPLAQKFGDLTGTKLDTYLGQIHEANMQTLRDLRPDPATVGTAGQILHGAFHVLPEVAAGTIAAGPVGGAATVGALTGNTAMQEAKTEGLDDATAIEKGVATGTINAVSAVLPATFGIRALAPELAAVATTNIAVGAAGRGVIHEILAANGYKAQANQYRVFDGNAMLADAVMGIFFGGVHRLLNGEPPLKQSTVDAAGVTQVDAHAKVDTAPGIPTTPEAARAHSEALLKATDDLLNDRPVDVSAAWDKVESQAGIDSFLVQMQKDIQENGRSVLAHAFGRDPQQMSLDLQEAPGRIEELPAAPNNNVVAEAFRQAFIRKFRDALPQTQEDLVKEIQTEAAYKEREQTALDQAEAETRLAFEAHPELANDIPKPAAETQTRRSFIENPAQKTFSEQMSLAIDEHMMSLRNELGIGKKGDFEVSERPVVNARVPEAVPEPTPGQSAQEPKLPPAYNEANPTDARPVDLEAAHQTLEVSPELRIATGEVDAKGNPVMSRASDVLKRADAELTQAKADGLLHQIAVSCFLRG